MIKILFLGAALHQTSIIKKAKEKGYYIITCDYFPDNPGHKFADEYYNVSTTDREQVLKIARECQVDAVIGYASDVSASTVAYVCQELGLSGNPLKSVEILTNKASYRNFLKENFFCTPRACSCTSYEDALESVARLTFPVMVKPIDSSGSKGITKIFSDVELQDAYIKAMEYSRKKCVLLEEFIQKKGYQISGDIFVVDGKVKFWSFGNEFYFQNSDVLDYVPMGECWPSMWSNDILDKVVYEIQKIVSKLKMNIGPFNVEAIIDNDDRVYVMELGPRNGGSLIPDLIYRVTGVDLQEYTLRASLGQSCAGLENVEGSGFWANYNVPSFQSGEFQELCIDCEFMDRHVELIETDYKLGDRVEKFVHGGNAVALVIMKFNTKGEMFSILEQLPRYISVRVK